MRAGAAFSAQGGGCRGSAVLRSPRVFSRHPSAARGRAGARPGGEGGGRWRSARPSRPRPAPAETGAEPAADAAVPRHGRPPPPGAAAGLRRAAGRR